MKPTILGVIPQGWFGLWFVSSFAPGLYCTKIQNSRLIRDEAGAAVTVPVSSQFAERRICQSLHLQLLKVCAQFDVLWIVTFFLLFFWLFI